jgi:hypothetical protein
MVEWLMNCRDSEGSGRDLVQVLSRNLPEGVEEKHENGSHSSLCQGEIRTEYLPNTSLDYYRYVIPLDERVIYEADHV